MEGKKSVKGKKSTTKTDSLDIYTLQENDLAHSLSYKYSTFDELIEQGEYNFFGIVYDASFPQEDNLSKYTCVLKLIDQTTNCLTNPTDFNEIALEYNLETEVVDNTFIESVNDEIKKHK